jgi:hypothetical protein
MRSLLCLALLVGATQSHAQTAASAPVTAPAPAPVSAAKKELVAKVLALQAPAFDGMARELVMRPVAQLGQEAMMALQSVPQDKREAAAKTIDGDMKKFVDEAVPMVRERAVKLAPTTIGPLLEERFSEDELKQLTVLLESGAYKKYQQLGGEMQNALGQKLVAETNPMLGPKFQALTQKVRVSLGVPPPNGAASGAAPKAAAKPPAKPASK